MADDQTTIETLGRDSLIDLARLRGNMVTAMAEEDIALFKKLNDGSFSSDDFFDMWHRKTLLLSELERQEEAILRGLSKPAN